MDLQLHDRVVIVTGASAGIGQASCEQLLAEGAIPVGVARHAPTGGSFSFVEADLAEPASAEAIVTQVVTEHGSVHGLVNNVGALTTRDGFLATTETPPAAVPAWFTSPARPPASEIRP